MTPEARILVGLGLVGAGAAGLLAMNLWTVPLLRPAAERGVSPAPERVATLVVPSASAPDAPTDSANADATAPLHAQAPDAAPSGSTQPGPELPGDASTSRSFDGATFPSIVFEPQRKTPSKAMLTSVEGMGAHLRENFALKVTLMGHGDAGMGAAEYVNLGRQRAAAVLRMLVDFGVSVSRIGIELPRVQNGSVVTQGTAPGTVEVRIEPRFPTPKEKERDVP
jgi:outer membrane protein OmpA-like peptidoglycan-associated protein